MYLPMPENNNANKGITDTAVLNITICLVLLMCVSPIFQVIAETLQKEDNSIVITANDKDHSSLLSFLFTRANKSVPEDAGEYINDINEYRVRVAKEVQRNLEVITVLDGVIKKLPKEIIDEHQDDIDRLLKQCEQQKIAILPFIQDEQFLAEAIIEKYNLHPVFTFEKLTAVLDVFQDKTNSLENLNIIRNDSTKIWNEIGILHQKIRISLGQA